MQNKRFEIVKMNTCFLKGNIPPSPCKIVQNNTLQKPQE